MAQNNKTVLILSENTDHSTSKVIDWINYYGLEPLRINKDTHISFVEFEISNRSTVSYILDIDGKKIDSSSIQSYWYRRGYFTFSTPKRVYNLLSDTISVKLNHHLIEEIEILEKTIHKINERKRSIGSSDNANLNKLDVLIIAKSLNIPIPDTKIITSKDQLNFKSEPKKNISPRLFPKLS